METNRIEYKQILADDLEKEVVAFLNWLGSGVPRILKVYSENCFVFADRFTRMVFPLQTTVKTAVKILEPKLSDLFFS